MRHVIVIETADQRTIGKINTQLQAIIQRVVEMALNDEEIVNFVQCRFNVESATAAIHEMYNTPVCWRGGND